MAEKPILFCQDMVRAILDGRKTQTRRVINAIKLNPDYGEPQWDKAWVDGIADKYYEYLHLPYGVGDGETTHRIFPRYEVGDLLWVRENFYYDLLPWANGGSLKYKPASYDEKAMFYLANGNCCEQIPECQCATEGKVKWRSARFMPKWAARLWLEVMKVRAERLQNITEEDAKAEGVNPSIVGQNLDYLKYRAGFQTLWESINAKRGFGWEKNPYVFVYEFKVVKK